MYTVGEKVLFTNTDDGEPVLVEVREVFKDTSGACWDPNCCGGPWHEYKIRLPDGSEERTSYVWLEDV